MTRRPRAVVTGVGSNVGQGIIRALRAGFPEAHVVGVDANPKATGLVAADAPYAVPYANDPAYTDALCAIIDREKADIVLVGSHFEVERLAGDRRRLEQATGAKVIVSPVPAAEICLDKYNTAVHLASHGCRAPRSFVPGNELDTFVREVGFPIIVKPRGGQGSHHLCIAEDRASLEEALTRVPDPIAQEYIGDPSEEYTAAGVVDTDGNVSAVMAMRRVLQAGTTVDAETGPYPDVVEEARRVIASLGTWGPINVQMRLGKSGPTTFEINPRFSGTTGMRALAGFNDVAAMVGHVLYDEPIDLRPPPRGRLIRFLDDVFIPDEGKMKQGWLFPPEGH